MTIRKEFRPVMVTRPPFRKLRGYAFDPSLSLRMDTVAINDIVYQVRWEKLGVGPAGEYVEVIDYDPTVDRFYKPVDLNNAYILAQDGLDPSESNPQFHQQMVYAVAMTTIHNFERALGRKIIWAPRRLADTSRYEEYVPKLRIYPHALREANAYYSPLKKALLFGYFSSSPAEESLHMPDSLVFTCLSHDIIAHEVTHAILDGMHRHYNEPTNADVLAFHEAFADIVALFQHFTFPEVLKQQIAKTRGDLAAQNLLGQLAQEFGSAIGSYGSLRDAIGQIDADTKQWSPKIPDPQEYHSVVEPHARGSILVAAVFEAFLNIYKSRVADLLRLASNGTGILQQGELHPDLVNRLASEAAKAAGHVLTMCIRALDYCPPVDITFGDYLRAVITADVDLVPDDRRDYRLAFIDAFRRRGIYPEGVKTLSVESLRQPLLNLGYRDDEAEGDGGAPQPGNHKIYQSGFSQEASGGTQTPPVLLETDNTTGELLVVIIKFLRQYGNQIKYVNDRQQIYEITREFISGTQSYSDAPVRSTDAPVTGLHARINVKFAYSSDFVKLTGLAFVDDPTQFGVRRSRRYPGPSFQIQSLRLVSRVGPAGNQINHVVFSILQRSGALFTDGRYEGPCEPPGELVQPDGGGNGPQRLEFRGGCTLIFDLDTLTLRYAIAKPLLDLTQDNPAINLDRLHRQYDFQHGDHAFGFNEYSMYFGNGMRGMSEPFAFLHQH